MSAQPSRPGPVQEQFLTVLPRDEAVRRFEAALDPRPLGAERVALADALGRILAETLRAPIDVPPDRMSASHSPKARRMAASRAASSSGTAP